MGSGDRGTPTDRRAILAILAVLAVGTFLRLMSCRSYVFQDEAPILINVAHFFARHTIVPSHFSYPTLFSYLVALPTGFATLAWTWAGVLGSPPDLVALFRFDSVLPLLPARLTSLVFGLATIVVVARTGATFFSREVGLLAAALLAVSPLHVLYSARALPDATATFFTLVCLHCSLVALRSGSGWFPLAGAAAGLATATKYNAALAVLATLAAYALHAAAHRPRFRTFLATAALTLLAFLVAFLAGSPGWLIVPGRFWSGLRFEQAHMATGHLGNFGTPYATLLRQLWTSEGTTAIVFALGVVSALWRPSPARAVLLAMVLLSFAYVGTWTKQGLHYLLFLYPALALLGADALFRVVRRQAASPWAIAVAVLAVLAWPGWISCRLMAECFREDSRWRAARWIEQSIPAGAPVIVDWSYVPRLVDMHERDDYRRVWRAGLLGNRPRETRAFHLVALEHEPDWIRERLHGDYLVTSQYCYERFFVSAPPPAGNPLRAEYDQRRALYATLLDEPARLGLARIQDVAGDPGPRILIYRRIGDGHRP